MFSDDTLLVVDDEPLALKYFARLFGERFDVLTAVSTAEALKILESRAETIGVVFSDQRMPGESGLTLLQHVRERFPGVVGILSTACSDAETLIQAINTGAVFSFVSKPWKMDELERTLERAFAARRDRIEMLLSSDLRIARAGFIASKIGHYVNNAFCPVTYLLDQLIANHRSSESLPLEFLMGVRKHVDDVVSTLGDLEKINGTAVREAFESIDIGKVLEEVLRETSLMREQKQLRLETQISGLIPPIRGFGPHIEKMVRFLIAEELVSLPAGSRVSVRLSTEEKPGCERFVKLEFEDYFPLARGMSAEELLHPFQLRGSDPRQFGVFLTSCHLIARNHGGRLTTETKKDEGMVYSVTLPTHATGFSFT